jgi:hypothetical protein
MILRHQLNVLQRTSPKRPTFGMLDHLIFAGLDSAVDRRKAGSRAGIKGRRTVRSVSSSSLIISPDASRDLGDTLISLDLGAVHDTSQTRIEGIASVEH